MKIMLSLIIVLVHFSAYPYSADLCETQEERLEISVSLMTGSQRIEAMNYNVQVYEEYRKQQEYIDFSDAMKTYLDTVYITVRDYEVAVRTPDILRYSQLYKVFLKDYPSYFPQGLSP